MSTLHVVESDEGPGAEERLERAKASAELVGWAAQAQVASLGTVLSIESAASGLQERLERELELHWSEDAAGVEYDKARRQRQGSLIEDLKAAMHIRLMCVDRVGRLSEQLGGLAHGKGGKATHKRKEGRAGAGGGGEVSTRAAERMGEAEPEAMRPGEVASAEGETVLGEGIDERALSPEPPEGE